MATFGDLGTSLKEYVQDYQNRSASQSPGAINSIADMKRFIEEYPEFRKLGGNVSKHVALVGELSRLVGRDKLLEVGEVEQGLATSAGADFKVNLNFSFLRVSLTAVFISEHANFASEVILARHPAKVQEKTVQLCHTQARGPAAGGLV